jgi:hypothetical protein
MKFFFISLVISASALYPSLSLSGDEGFRFGKNPAIEQVRPKKPVTIKLRRTAEGKYSWDITGDDAQEIINADRRLRRQFIVNSVR